MLVKFVVLILLLVLSLAIASPSRASFCRQQGNGQICILQIKRSAKHYWEYRAKVSIDGKVRPMEIYNCRDRLHIKKSGQIIPFTPKGAGEYICSFFQK